MGYTPEPDRGQVPHPPADGGGRTPTRISLPHTRETFWVPCLPVTGYVQWVAGGWQGRARSRTPGPNLAPTPYLLPYYLRQQWWLPDGATHSVTLSSPPSNPKWVRTSRFPFPAHPAGFWKTGLHGYPMGVLQ